MEALFFPLALYQLIVIQIYNLNYVLEVFVLLFFDWLKAARRCNDFQQQDPPTISRRGTEFT